MISKEYGNFHLVCDICSNEADETFSNFDDAVQFKKSSGWKSQRRSSGEWEDVCPGCQKNAVTGSSIWTN